MATNFGGDGGRRGGRGVLPLCRELKVWVLDLMRFINPLQKGLPMCASVTKSGPSGADTMGDEHLQRCHVLKV